MSQLENSEEKKSCQSSDDRNEVIVCIISDTHGHHNDLTIPKADILIHCGDFTNFSNVKHLYEFNEWLSTIPIPREHKFIVTGNHENKANFELKSGTKIDFNVCLSNGTFLEKQMIKAFGINIFGQGWQGNYQRKWNILEDVDIVITHNPPFGILDGNDGCKELKANIDKIKPLIHCFGHIHEDYGIYHDDKSGVYYINAASVNHQRKITKEPILIKISKKKQLTFEVMNESKESLFRDKSNDEIKPKSALKYVI